VFETEVEEIRVALSDFLRRIGLFLRRDDPLQPGGRGARTAGRQASETTVGMPRPGSAHEPAATPSPSDEPESSESAPAKPAPVAPHAPVQPLEASEPPPIAVAPPVQGEPQADPRPEPSQPAASGGVDPLAETRVVSAAQTPIGQVVGVLVAVEGELEGQTLPIIGGGNRLGRHPECEVCLSSEWISRHHAKIEYENGIFKIEASGDKPTIVNSEQIERSELHDGDYITLGKTTLRFRSIL
jgi:hypothetical protein